MLTKADDGGFTMVELLMSVAITAILAIAVFSATSTASAGIARDVDVAVSSVQSVRLAQALTYDVSGAVDAYVYGVEPEVGANPPCTTWPPGDATAWRDAQAPGFVRPLFTLRIPTLDEGSSARFLPTVQVRVGYELRRSGSDSRAVYALARVVCDSSGTRGQAIVTLGHTIDSAASGLTTLLCRTAAGGFTALVPGASTASLPEASQCASLAFRLPYEGTRAVLQALAHDASLDALTSMVGSS